MYMIQDQRNRILFIDFNGVISYDPFWSSLFNTVHDNHGWSKKIHNYLFTGNNNIINDWMLGNLTSEDVHDKIELELDLPKHELFPIFEKDCQALDLSLSIRQVLEVLKKDYYIIMVTDNMDSMDRYTIPANIQYFRVFDRIDNSSRMKRFKRDNNCQYFAEVLGQLNVQPKDSVYIDDSLVNCSVFKERFPDALCFNSDTENEAIRSLETLV